MHWLLARIPFVRRPFYQRDAARQERDLAVLEQNELIQERDALMLALQDATAEPLRETAGAPARLEASPERLCVFCNSPVEAWLPSRIRESEMSGFLKKLEPVGSNPERFYCPHCSSIDRERHLRLFLDRLGIMEAVRGGSVQGIIPQRMRRMMI